MDFHIFNQKACADILVTYDPKSLLLASLYLATMKWYCHLVLLLPQQNYNFKPSATKSWNRSFFAIYTNDIYTIRTNLCRYSCKYIYIYILFIYIYTDINSNANTTKQAIYCKHSLSELVAMVSIPMDLVFFPTFSFYGILIIM